MPVEHGLSLYIERSDGKVILFDMGQGSLFVDNAERLGMSIPAVDTAIISHGHYDHGGGLRTFLEHNDHAQVFVHREAFSPHYSLKETGLRYIGLDSALISSEQVVLCADKVVVDDHMTLIADIQGECCTPVGNKLLYGPDMSSLDCFRHEQNLIIEDAGMTVLFAGCAHRGIVNIMRRVVEVIGHAPTHVFAGMHLVKSGLDSDAEESFISELSQHLLQYEGCMYYTMHCTGTDQYEMLKRVMGDRIEYLSCGDSCTLGSSINVS